MPEWTGQLAGRFIVFDGPDGSGKSTQFARFAEWARTGGVTVTEVREPGGTAIGEQIRRILLDPANTEMSVRCELMLYMASRAQLVDAIIRPSIDRGELLLADRFVSSTLAYQGSGGGLDRLEIMAVADVAIGACWPDLVVIFDVDETTAARRLTGGHRQQSLEPTLFSDRMENRHEAYRRRVREGYLEQAREDPERYVVINGAREPDEVFKALLAAIEGKLGV